MKKMDELLRMTKIISDGHGFLDQRERMFKADPFITDTTYLLAGECLECGAMRRAYFPTRPEEDKKGSKLSGRIKYASCEFCHPPQCRECNSPMQVDSSRKPSEQAGSAALVCNACGNHIRPIRLVAWEKDLGGQLAAAYHEKQRKEEALIPVGDLPF